MCRRVLGTISRLSAPKTGDQFCASRISRVLRNDSTRATIMVRANGVPGCFELPRKCVSDGDSIWPHSARTGRDCVQETHTLGPARSCSGTAPWGKQRTPVTGTHIPYLVGLRLKPTSHRGALACALDLWYSDTIQGGLYDGWWPRVRLAGSERVIAGDSGR